jgi:hypothetical protein
VLYQRDYLNLLVKYGLEEPSQKALLVTDQRVLVTDPRVPDADISSMLAG